MKKILASILFLSTNAFACECAHYPSFEEKVQSAKTIAIMEARLIEKTSAYGEPKLVYKFKPLETLKGETLKEYTLVEQAPRSNCDLAIEPRYKYLVFHGSGSQLGYGVCSNTAPLYDFDSIKPDFRTRIKQIINSNKALQKDADNKRRVF